MTEATATQEDWDKLREDSRQTLPDAIADAVSLPSVLLPYQSQLLASTAVNQLVVVEKSRRIGMTWAVAADAVLSAGSARNAGGMDVLYIGYNLDMAREFIDTCAMWAKAFIPAASGVEEFLFKDQSDDGQDKDINAFRIKFASGFDIVALTSKPRSLRGRQGYVIFDEAAFHDELGELLKAAMALLMWGGKVLVISTHDGVDNPFNQFILDVRSGKREGEVLRVTFDEAIADGLYERIALVTGKPSTAEARNDWITSIMGFYGDDADEELHCIPKAGSGAYISGAAVEACMVPENHVARLICPPGFELRPMDERRQFVDDFLEEEVSPHLARLDPKRLSALGEDFGRTTDLTVLSVAQELSDLRVDVPIMVELKNMPIEQQKQVVLYIVTRLPRFIGAKFDATGNGLALGEWAQEEFGHNMIEAVKITQSWYLENMPSLKAKIEDQTIRLPRDSDVKDDVRSIKLINGIPSVPKDRKAGRHGDAAVSLCMVVAALKEDYQEFKYRAVKATSRDPLPRPIKTTGGFKAQKGAF